MISKQEQINIIQQILNKPDPVPDAKFSFGKYKHMSFKEVLRTDKQYVLWCYHSNAPLGKRMIKYIETHVLKE